ncbi:MAG: hypothetical protein HYU36_08245 [Planctomycetes bacterium]|nr:hypothetical protein [Planctomycetota bacterium]
MSLPQPTIHLTTEQVKHYHEEGYLAVEAATTQEEKQTARMQRAKEAEARKRAQANQAKAGADALPAAKS